MSYTVEQMYDGGGICPTSNPQTCCEVLVKCMARLTPPAIVDEKFPIIVKRRIDAKVKKVCPGKVIIEGIIHNKINYRSLERYGVKILNSQLFDDMKFHCVMDRNDANEGDKFAVIGTEILCVVDERPVDIRPDYENFGFELAHKFVAESLVTICIRKVCQEK